MVKIPLRVVPEPAEGTAAVLKSADGVARPFMKGTSTGHDYVCGSCGAVLLEAMARGQVQQLILHCAACGAYNDSSSLGV
jgi:hypothetical protein